MDNKQTKTLYDMLNNYLSFYKEFLEFENQKLKDVADNKIKSIDEHVKNEEVFLLKCRGFEVKREAFLKEIGMDGKTMQEVIDSATDDMKEKLSSSFQELSETILDLQEINKRCNTMIELRLHNIQKTLGQLEENRQNLKKKSNKGEKKFSDFISRKV